MAERRRYFPGSNTASGALSYGRLRAHNSGAFSWRIVRYQSLSPKRSTEMNILPMMPALTLEEGTRSWEFWSRARTVLIAYLATWIFGATLALLAWNRHLSTTISVVVLFLLVLVGGYVRIVHFVALDSGTAPGEVAGWSIAFFAALLLLSPIDFLPLLPIDDLLYLVVMAVAVLCALASRRKRLNLSSSGRNRLSSSS